MTPPTPLRSGHSSSKSFLLSPMSSASNNRISNIASIWTIAWRISIEDVHHIHYTLYDPRAIGVQQPIQSAKQTGAIHINRTWGRIKRLTKTKAYLRNLGEMNLVSNVPRFEYVPAKLKTWSILRWPKRKQQGWCLKLMPLTRQVYSGE